MADTLDDAMNIRLAIARAIRDSGRTREVDVWPLTRAAYAALVEHLELTEERGSGEVPGRSRYRRLVSKWVEVQP